MDQFSLFDGGVKAPEPTSESPNVVYFDLETIRSADEVGGWSFIKKMGMACGVIYTTKTQDYHVFMEDQVMDLVHMLRAADLIVGFNHIRFDYEVLRGYSNFDFLTLPSFDMLVDLKERLGHRVKLDSVAKSTLGVAKSADGLQSLRWVKEGKLDLVVDYCKQDVKVTKEVFEHGRDHAFVNIDNLGSPQKVSVDWKLTRLVPEKPQHALL